MAVGFEWVERKLLAARRTKKLCFTFPLASNRKAVAAAAAVGVIIVYT